jgi:hypothetical protein
MVNSCGKAGCHFSRVRESLLWPIYKICISTQVKSETWNDNLSWITITDRMMRHYPIQPNSQNRLKCPQQQGHPHPSSWTPTPKIIKCWLTYLRNVPDLLKDFPVLEACATLNHQVVLMFPSLSWASCLRVWIYRHLKKRKFNATSPGYT